MHLNLERILLILTYIYGVKVINFNIYKIIVLKLFYSNQFGFLNASGTFLIKVLQLLKITHNTYKNENLQLMMVVIKIRKLLGTIGSLKFSF